MLVTDHGLIQLADAFNDVHQVIDYAVLQTHYDVQITEADVGVDHHHPVAAHCQGSSDVGGGSGLAHPALA